ncbi:hypothetical protein GCM10027416_23800 [Okibacterium endophyticum]
MRQHTHSVLTGSDSDLPGLIGHAQRVPRDQRHPCLGRSSDTDALERRSEVTPPQAPAFDSIGEGIPNVERAVEVVWQWPRCAHADTVPRQARVLRELSTDESGNTADQCDASPFIRQQRTEYALIRCVGDG